VVVTGNFLSFPLPSCEFPPPGPIPTPSVSPLNVGPPPPPVYGPRDKMVEPSPSCRFSPESRWLFFRGPFPRRSPSCRVSTKKTDKRVTSPRVPTFIPFQNLFPLGIFCFTRLVLPAQVGRLFTPHTLACPFAWTPCFDQILPVSLSGPPAPFFYIPQGPPLLAPESFKLITHQKNCPSF